MNRLEMYHLVKFCRKHELDVQLIDNTLTYSENKKYLVSQIPNFNPSDKLKAWEAAKDQYFETHFLYAYIGYILEGKTKLVPSSNPSRPMEPHFSLRQHVKAQTHKAH